MSINDRKSCSNSWCGGYSRVGVVAGVERGGFKKETDKTKAI